MTLFTTNHQTVFAMSSHQYTFPGMHDVSETYPYPMGQADSEEDMDSFYLASPPASSYTGLDFEPAMPAMPTNQACNTTMLAPMSGSYLPYGEQWTSQNNPTTLNPNPQTYLYPDPSTNSNLDLDTKDLTNYGIPNPDGSWRCAYPGCTSAATFHRGCDLRKHFNRHRKHLFCRHEGCPQAVAGGFSSKKDRARHEAKHNPGVVCEWPDCGRVFSRVDNMKDHVRRIHKRGEVDS
ncbi:putative C2H2 transcription factor [Aspergillus novofumigatus IBT 16806]|uniref:C2H2 type zinc finger domain protein n=1 Tax=Aspergillus novofumigatus (strain IBT 16806) TaxID=1392255 RepID=A0A2I1BWG3_ASPN1|nr:C2H2 type zinc finger domain protein [Aspergillus novofumigatus IBT 16806]PKX89696.1 C2H2 type zinc finger domain protein [Aspergillus novofumigatus IBT 16806]